MIETVILDCDEQAAIVAALMPDEVADPAAPIVPRQLRRDIRQAIFDHATCDLLCRRFLDFKAGLRVLEMMAEGVVRVVGPDLDRPHPEFIDRRTGKVIRIERVVEPMPASAMAGEGGDNKG
jgi:hypothetical protein